MKKIMIRAHMSPFNTRDTSSILRNDSVGTNIGNLVYINSIIRALMTEDTQIDTFNTRTDLTPEFIRRINGEYSCVILPFANAFRISFEGELRAITNFIKKLNVPCIVIGVGTSTVFQKDLTEHHTFDEAVREFVRAVLDKSAVLGTRGEYTSAYLSHLGFKEGSEHRVIGCPSMFWYGEELPQIRKKELTKDSAVSVNWKIDLPDPLHHFIQKSIACFENFQYVPQITDEIRLMYYGMPFPEGKYKRIPDGYPCVADHPWYRSDRARSFVDVLTWMEYMKEKDFSFGSRIHGNIVPLLTGTPSFVISSDYRIEELARYHNIPHIDYRELQETDTIFRFYENADYDRVQKGHKERFENYRKFLEENGLEHTYDIRDGLRPYDRKMQTIPRNPALRPFFSVPVSEQCERLAECGGTYMRLQGKYDKLKPLEMLLEQYHINKGLKRAFQRLHR